MHREDAEAFLRELVGTWRGRGSGGYPTIEPFAYRDELVVEPGIDDGLLHYVERAWRITPEGEVPSHQESGFLHAAPDGTIVILNAQGRDRVEVLRGALRRDRDGSSWTLDLVGALHGNDPRMASAARTYQLTGDDLAYEMRMSTDRVPSPETHLRARLRRQEGTRAAAG